MRYQFREWKGMNEHIDSPALSTSSLCGQTSRLPIGHAERAVPEAKDIGAPCP
jgi:hypothetical protein